MALRSFDGLFAEAGHGVEVLLGGMGTNLTWEHAIPNAIMASRRHAPFWLLLLRQMVANSPRCRVDPSFQPTTAEYESGPVVLQRTVQLFGSRVGVRVLPSDCWYPFAWNTDEWAAMHKAGSYFRPELQDRAYVLAKGYASNLSYAVTFWTHTRQGPLLDAVNALSRWGAAVVHRFLRPTPTRLHSAHEGKQEATAGRLRREQVAQVAASSNRNRLVNASRGG
mmetsp:Transcript_2451/g.7386  ORF Transcript_2451/g.7386 Transcript_2451/m.7386 type:complete len:223 (+) Transcript_2451:499-1167(+)